MCWNIHLNINFLEFLHIVPIKGWQIHPTGQIWLTDHRSNLAHKIIPDFLYQVLQKHGAPNHFHIVFGCSHTTTTRLSNCYRDYMVHELGNIYYLAFTESFSTAGLDCSYRMLFSNSTRTSGIKNEFNVIIAFLKACKKLDDWKQSK